VNSVQRNIHRLGISKEVYANDMMEWLVGGGSVPNWLPKEYKQQYGCLNKQKRLNNVFYSFDSTALRSSFLRDYFQIFFGHFLNIFKVFKDLFIKFFDFQEVPHDKPTRENRSENQEKDKKTIIDSRKQIDGRKNAKNYSVNRQKSLPVHVS
jgi:hypothetical protein